MKEYEVLKSFNDKTNENKLVKINSTYKCEDKRAEELKKKGFLGNEVVKEEEYHIEID